MAVQAGIESKWTNDTQRLLLEHFDIIQSSPSHIYHSALPLFPSSSWLHRCYNAEPSAMVKVVKGLPTEWGVCSRTVFLDDYTWTLSYCNSSIAIGSESGDIIILDSATGTQRATLSGHTDTVCYVEFSSDGILLVSGGHDNTVKLWDMQTGGVVRTFSGHTDWVWCVSISVDCTKVVSGSRDETVRLWDIQTGKCHRFIKGLRLVQEIRFSPTNPQYFISVGADRIRQWDTNYRQTKPPQYGSSVSFSPDGTQLVSCYRGAVTVWNSNSGAVASTFHLGDKNTNYCCFSPDSRLVAVAASNIIYIWNITSSDPHLVRTFIGHVNGVSAIAFSSSSTLISASFDKSVKFWQVYTSSPEPVMSSLEPTPAVLPLVSSVSLLVRDGIAISGDTVGEVKTWDISINPHGVPTQRLTQDSRYGDTKQGNSRLIFVWYMDEMLNIWNAEKGEFILQSNIPKHNILDLRISEDGSMIFYIHSEFIQAWDVWTGVATDIREYRDVVDTELLAVDGLGVWIEYTFHGCVDREFMGWNFVTLNSSPVDLYDDPPAGLHLSNTKFWDSNLCRILDTVTGKVVFQLPAQYGRPVDVQWNGQYLVASAKSKEELVLLLHPTLLQ